MKIAVIIFGLLVAYFVYEIITWFIKKMMR
jgi:hypothetical protein